MTSTDQTQYILVRPYPSLRIIFTSPALRIPGLSQSKLMDRVGGPQHIREGLLDALAQGSSVTAKISWLTQSSNSSPNNRSGDASPTATHEPESHIESRPRWIHCTPLLGSDSKPGVYMIVMVDKEEITGALNARLATIPVVRSVDLTRETWPQRPVSGVGTSAAKLSTNKLYADYLRREGSSASERPHSRRQTPSRNRTSLEEDIRMGRVNSGLARVAPDPRAGTPYTELASGQRSSRVQTPTSPYRPYGVGELALPFRSHPASRQSIRERESEDDELVPPQMGASHGYNVSMDTGAPTPPRQRSTTAEIDYANENRGEGT
jgi:hypothetical protein